MSRKKPLSLVLRGIPEPAYLSETPHPLKDAELEFTAPKAGTAVWLTATAVARYMGLSNSQFSRLAHDPVFGWVKTFKPRTGAHLRYLREDVERYVAEHMSTVAKTKALA